MPRSIALILEHGDITTMDADVIALKFAQQFHGADLVVAEALVTRGLSRSSLQPATGDYRYVGTNGGVKAAHALFVGVKPLYQLTYADIRVLAGQVLRILAQEAPATRSIAMTIHGPGFGLDETEACLAQVDGYLDSLQQGHLPPALERIIIVDRSASRITRLRAALDLHLPTDEHAHRSLSGAEYRLAIPDARTPQAAKWGAEGDGAETSPRVKPHIFVAMPFSAQMNDVYYYGIQSPVHAVGFLCERMDHIAFTGEIIDWMKTKIETAAVVVAELSGGNPNVYLEVGYAWGKGRPTILLAPKVEELAFDVRGHKCLVYDGIRNLEELLTRELAELRARHLI